MQTRSLWGWLGDGRSTRRHGRRSSDTYRPVLEPLEDRTTPAVVTPAAAVVPTGTFPTVPAQTAPLTTTQIGGPQLVTQVIGSKVVTLPAPGGNVVQLPPQPSSSSPLPTTTTTTTGFAGRLVFPGTDLQVRSATGDGPFTQLPGVYPVGGSNGLPPTLSTPQPTRPVIPPVVPLGLPGIGAVDDTTALDSALAGDSTQGSNTDQASDAAQATFLDEIGLPVSP
jgi:hypothetical protein